MKILLLAPQPFFQERGTPIAVDLLLRSLSDGGHMVDLLTYHEGAEVTYPNMTIHRIAPPRWVRNIRPGFSFKKLVCSFYMLAPAFRLARQRRPDIVHAVEESVFIAWLLRGVYKLPYIYDMDSSIPGQIVEKFPALRPLRPIMTLLFRFAVAPALLVAPVCDALADEAGKSYRARKLVLLQDVSLLNHERKLALNLRAQLGLSGICFMYVGNLERYQGLDLLLESFALHRKQSGRDSLVIVGGTQEDIGGYQTKAAALGIGQHVYFLGPQPVSQMAAYFDEADVLVSPRIKGSNTPMKIYSYLDSGKPVLATRLYTHTQVLNDEVACLAAPDAADFARAMARLSEDEPYRRQLAQAGGRLVQNSHSLDAFKKAVNEIYAYAQSQLHRDALPGAPQEASG